MQFTSPEGHAFLAGVVPELSCPRNSDGQEVYCVTPRLVRNFPLFEDVLQNDQLTGLFTHCSRCDSAAGRTHQTAQSHASKYCTKVISGVEKCSNGLQAPKEQPAVCVGLLLVHVTTVQLLQVQIKEY
jgi:hypothetical protein